MSVIRKITVIDSNTQLNGQLSYNLIVVIELVIIVASELELMVPSSLPAYSSSIVSRLLDW